MLARCIDPHEPQHLQGSVQVYASCRQEGLAEGLGSSLDHMDGVSVCSTLELSAFTSSLPI